VISSLLEWDWEAAEPAFLRAIELDPGSVFGRQTYSTSLASQGRLDEAFEQMLTANELDPLATARSDLDLGLLYKWKGEPLEAEAYWRHVLELRPNHYSSLDNLGAHYCATGRTKEGLALLERARELYPETPQVLAGIGACYATAGRREEAEAVLTELDAWSQREYVDPVTPAQIYLALGDDDHAFAALERGYAGRAFMMTQIGWDPRFARLHRDPRFRDLLERIGLREHPPRG
jgi:tetratricopeptide (TPR) repeat protein